MRTIQARGTTAQSKQRAQANYAVNEALIRPYSNFAPSGGTRSNIMIERVKSQLQNQSALLQSNGRKSSSKKIISTVNEYEDDSILTLNSNNYDKRSNLNTIIGVKNKDDTLSNIYIAKQNSKEQIQNPRLNKLAKKDSIRAKSNKRTNKINFEKVYMQSPLKLINRRPTNQPKLKHNLNACDSGGLINNSVSPHMPKVKEAIAREVGHKTTLKKRSEHNLIVFNQKQDLLPANNIRDNSK